MGKRIKSYPILRFWSCIGSAVLLCACTGRNTTQVQYQAAEHSAVVAYLAQDEGKDMQEQLADSSLNSLATEQEGQLTDETVARMDASFGGDVDTLSDAERRMIEAGLVEIVPNDSTFRSIWSMLRPTILWEKRSMAICSEPICCQRWH